MSARHSAGSDTTSPGSSLQRIPHRCHSRRTASHHLILLALLASHASSSRVLQHHVALLLLQLNQLLLQHLDLLRLILLVLLKFGPLNQPPENDVGSHAQPVLGVLHFLHSCAVELALDAAAIEAHTVTVASDVLVQTLSHVLLEVLLVCLVTLELLGQLAIFQTLIINTLNPLSRTLASRSRPPKPRGASKLEAGAIWVGVRGR